MNKLLLVARRDLAAYLNSYWGYAVITVVLIADGLLFNAWALGDKPKLSSKVIEDFFFFSFGLTCFASVLLTMRLIAEERQTGTMVLIDSSPLSNWQLLGGKYLSALTILSLMILATAYMPALVFVNGKVSYGHIVAGYSGLILVAASTAAMGTFASTIARSQLVAGFIAAVVVLFFVLSWLLARVADPPLNDLFSYSAIFDRHFRGFMQGKINTEDIVFHLSLAFGFLLMSGRFLAARRWR